MNVACFSAQLKYGGAHCKIQKNKGFMFHGRLWSQTRSLIGKIAFFEKEKKILSDFPALIFPPNINIVLN